MKKLTITAVLFFSFSIYKANASNQSLFKDTTVTQKIALLEQKVNRQEQEIKTLKEEGSRVNSKSAPVITRKRFIVTRTGSKQVVGVD